MNKRIDFIDAARGLAILLVILGHCCSTTTGVVNRTVLSFHMPLFFFISGIFAKNISLLELWGGVKMKAKKLLIPQIILGLTAIPLKGKAWLAEGNNLIDFDFLQVFFAWFLPTLFFCSIIHMLITCFADTRKSFVQISVIFFTITIALLMLYYYESEEGVLYQYLRIIPVAFLFYELGSYTKDRILSKKLDFNGISGLIILMILPLLVVLAQWNEPVKMYKGVYGSYFILFLLTACIGTFIVINVSKLIKLNILEELGKLSIALYVWNFIVIRFTQGIIRFLLEKTGLYTDVVLASLSFIISVIILYGLSKITLKYTPFIYGQKKI